MDEGVVERVEVAGAADDDLRPLHELWAEEQGEQYPDDPPLPFAESLDYLRQTSRFVEMRHWVVRPAGGGGAWGWAELRLRRETDANQHLCGVELFVTAAQRRRGVASRLLHAALDDAVADQRTVVKLSTAWDGPHEPFVSALGLERRYRERYSRLYLDELPSGLLEAWVERAGERAGGYSLHGWRGRTPDDVIEAWAAARDIMNTAPREGLEDEDWHNTADMVRDEDDRLETMGEDHWVIYARHDASGAIAGYTELYFGAHRRWMAWQGRTAVDPEHRERGLGRWVKAAMLQALVAERPEVRWVETDNAGSNEPMLAINDALGFRPVRWVGVWQGDIARAQSVLAGRVAARA